MWLSREGQESVTIIILKEFVLVCICVLILVETLIYSVNFCSEVHLGIFFVFRVLIINLSVMC